MNKDEQIRKVYELIANINAEKSTVASWVGGVLTVLVMSCYNAAVIYTIYLLADKGMLLIPIVLCFFVCTSFSLGKVAKISELRKIIKDINKSDKES